MASTILYPPIVESVAPAIIAAENSICRIYFSLSRFNAESDFKNVHVSIYKQDSGLNIVNKTLDSDNKYRATGIILNVPFYKLASEENKYYIEIINNDLINGWQLGWFYKVQIRLSAEEYDNSISQTAWLNTFAGSFSEWSTSCIFKSTGISSFIIPNYGFSGSADVHEVITSELDFIGSYSNSDNSESLYSYKIQLYDATMSLLEESDLLYANQYTNINQLNYIFKIEPIQGNTYIVKLTYNTISRYTNLITFTCLIGHTMEDAINIELLTAENDKNNIMYNLTSIFDEEEEGRIGLKLYSENDSEIVDIMIRRADSRDNFATWTDIKNLSISADANTFPIVYDYTIESGIWYKYGIQKYVKTVNSVTRGPLNIISTPIMRNFNYTFLLGENNQQLKLQFNNTLNNYKININEGKITTLGGQFPFISRNGVTNYKTFSLNGLISFNMDENGLFFTKEQAYKFDEIIELYKQYNNQYEITHYDYIFEKEFRNAVIDFLHNGKVKLLKSPTEGNILVRLTDIGLSPQQSLSRIIYDFSSIVNEIAANSMENYKKYGLYQL